MSNSDFSFDSAANGIPGSVQFSTQQAKQQWPVLRMNPVPIEGLRSFEDTATIRRYIFDDVKNAAATMQPVTNNRYSLTLEDVSYGKKFDKEDPEEEITPERLKKAVMQRQSINRRLYGTWTLRDNTLPDKPVIAQSRKFVADVPYMLDHGVFVKNGTNYSLRNQSRLLPGAYTRKQDNGEVETHVNAQIHQGMPHRYMFDTKTGVFSVKVGSSKTPIVTLLRAMGATDKELKEVWPHAIYAANVAAAKSSDKAKLVRLFASGKYRQGETEDEQLRNALSAISVDPGVTRATLGRPYTNVNKDMILDATRRIYNVSQGTEEMDNRDNLAYQEVYGPEDLFSERLLKDAGRLRRQLLMQLTFGWKGDVSKIPPGVLSRQIGAVLQDGLGVPVEEINRTENLDKLYAITRIGPGGISGSRAVPYESRDVQASYRGFVDPIRTPESDRVGVDLFLARGARKGRDRKLYTQVFDREGVPHWKSAAELTNATVGILSEVDNPEFGDFTTADGEHVKGIDLVPAMRDGQLVQVRRDEVDYVMKHFSEAFSPLANFITNQPAAKGHRIAMGSRMQTQSLPLASGEAPLVRSLVATDGINSYEKEYGHFLGAMRTEEDATVRDVSYDKIVLQYDDGRVVTKHLTKHLPTNRKTQLNQTPVVEIGQRVPRGGLIAKSNMTDNEGNIAIGQNARIAMVPWEGSNFEDAMVVSESFAKRMKSQHAYQYHLDNREDDKASLRDFVGLFPHKFSRKQFETLGLNGVVKPGTKVSDGDPLILSAAVKDPRKRQKKSSNYSDRSILWEHHDPGFVTDVYYDDEGAHVVVAMETGLHVGDKLSGRYGNKGVIGLILPDDRMPVLDDGLPAEVAMNPNGTITRCYDAETELLTQYGWKKIGDVARTDWLMAFDPQTQTMRFTDQLDAMTKQYYSGDMYCFENKRTSFCVTPGHTMYFRTGKGDWQIAPVDTLSADRRYFVAMTEVTDGNTVDVPVFLMEDGRLMSDLPLLLSLFYACGRLDDENKTLVFKTDGATVSHRMNKDVDVLRKIKSAFVSFGVTETDGVYVVKDADGRLYDWFKSFVVTGDNEPKNYVLPDCVYAWPLKNKWEFLNNILQFIQVEEYSTRHGAKYRHKKAWNFTHGMHDRLWMSESLQTLANTMGLQTDTVTDNARSGMQYKRITVIYPPQTRKNEKTTPDEQPNLCVIMSHTKNPIDKHYYQGDVYCPTVATGFVLTRRNGNRTIVAGNTNPAQLIELALSKVAKARGKAYELADFETPEDLTEFAIKEAEKYGVNINSPVIDPRNGREIKNEDGTYAASGLMWLSKLHHMAESKSSARGIGGYTQNETPSRGGSEGSKRIGASNLSALISHGAYGTYREARDIRGNKNDEFWLQFMAGQTPSPSKMPLVHQKFIEEMKASGINVIPDEGRIRVMALTDDDIDAMSGGRQLSSADTYRWGSDKKPVKGGLFDPSIFGDNGERWGVIKSEKPVLNPVMEDSVLKLLDLTQERFSSIIHGKEGFDNYGTGMEAISAALELTNVEKDLENLRKSLPSLRGVKRDKAVKKLALLKGVQATGIHPSKWILNSVPVLPPRFRPVSEMQGGSGNLLVADVNYLYKQFIDSNDAIRSLKSHGVSSHEDTAQLYKSFRQIAGLDKVEHPKLVQKNVKGLLTRVFGDGSSKFSAMQRTVLGTPVDTVGRGVIAPNPDMDMDSVGIPENLAWKTYETFIIRDMSKKGVPLLQAKNLLDSRDPFARRSLLNVMQERPVYLDRAPIMHKFSVIAARPRLVKGDTIQLSPLVYNGLAADNDGDAQFDHVFIRTKRGAFEKIVANLPLDSLSVSSKLDGTVNLPVQETDNKEESNMAGYNNVDLVTKQSHDVRIVHLQDFPRTKKCKETQGQFGHIDWYEVPDDVEVITHDPTTGSTKWTKPSYFSVHHDCELELVEFQSGRQIVTDNDPRAVYGLDCNTWTFTRRTPAASLSPYFMVPRMRYADNLAGVKKYGTLSTDKYTKTKEASCLIPTISIDEKFGYLLGVMIGDGWVSQATSGLHQVYIADAEGDVAEKIHELVTEYTLLGEKQFRKGEELTHGKRDMSYNAYGKSMRHQWNNDALGLMIKDIVGHGCRNKHLPTWFMETFRSFRSGLLAGLMDTDGGVGVSHLKNKPQLLCNYTTTHLRLAQEVVLLASSLGISATITDNKTPAGLPVWCVNLSTVGMKKWNGEFMQSKVKLQKIHETAVFETSPIVSRYDLIPIPVPLTTFLLQLVGCKKVRTTTEDERRYRLYMSLHKSKKTGYLSRNSAEFFIEEVRELQLNTAHDLWDDWVKIVKAVDITWDYVTSVKKTGRTETGYDLTVPGSDTFVNAKGTILSNTMNFHIPLTAAATREAYDLMLPSKSLLSPLDMKSPMHKPTQEYISGLYSVTEKREKNPKAKVFASREDAVRALRRGDITMTEQIIVTD